MNRKALAITAIVAFTVASTLPAWSDSNARNVRVGDTGIDVTTFHYDNARLGWNSAEKALKPSLINAGGFGKVWSAPTDGLVWGSPLVLSKVAIGGQVRSLVFAATDRNSVYAIDSLSGDTVWVRRELARPLSEAQFLGSWDLRRSHGILSTPVIDVATNRIYVCTLEAHGLRQFYSVWALDVRTGGTIPGYPVRLSASDRGTKFSPGEVIQRGALSLVNGWLIAPFGGRGDVPAWRGWVVALNTNRPDAPTVSVCLSPFVDGAGVWSGGGVSATDAEHIYAVTGNGTYDLDSGGSCVAQSVVRLRLGEPRMGIRPLDPKEIYTPGNHAFLDEEDEDLGGSTANVLPPQPGGHPHMLFTGGKDGLAYLLNADSLGGVGGELQKMRLFCPEAAIYHEGIRSTSAYFDAGEHGRFVYVAGDQVGPEDTHGIAALQLGLDPIVGQVRMHRVWTLGRDLDGPSSPIVSSDGENDGIVWVVETKQFKDSALLAYDALSGKELYDSSKATPLDQFDGGRRFSSPVVANGRVYVGAKGLICFALKGKRE